MIQFENPAWFWVLLPLVPFLLFWRARSYADLRPGRANVATLMRLLGLVLITMALTRPILLLENSSRSVLFLVDVSDSVPDASVEEAWSRITELTGDLDDNQEAGVVLFAREPRLVATTVGEPLDLTPELVRKLHHAREERTIIARIQELERSDLDEITNQELEELRGHLDEITAWKAELGTDTTDIEAACRLARGLLPYESLRRVMLFSDGNTNRGELPREVAELRRAEVSAHAALLTRTADPEVIAESVTLPAEVQVKAPFTVDFRITSNVATPATLKIYRDKYKVDEQQVELKEGRNLFSMEKVRLEKGFHEFEVVIEPELDTVIENNVAKGIVRVDGRPKVLLVERNERDARYLEEALAGEEIEVQVRPESGLPQDMNDLLNYDALILSDVTASNFAPGAMDLVKTYVREMGGGLVMLGGEHSFGLGGYYRTPIEDALPVKMPIKKNIEKPNLAISLVIDKSGSMSGTKMELAKEAAIASAEVLKGNDRFGVIAFDGRAEVITPMTDSSDLSVIISTIARLQAGGGTNIYPGLYQAWEALAAEDAKLKHIILLSDGQTTGSGYDTLVSHIASDGITLSTVGIGEGADQNLLGDLAEWGDGEYYFTNDFGSIPQILTRETMRASKSMIVEEPFIPTSIAETEILKGLDPDDLPFLLGYVATQARETATVGLASDYGDPILASWTYGLGRSVAFTSDAKARWGGDWVSWEGFGKFWGQLVRSVMSTGSHQDLRTRTRIDVEDGIARVTLDVRDRIGAFRDDVMPDVAIFREGGQEPDDLDVEHLGPGLFEASFPIEEYGRFYHLMITQSQGEKVVDAKALGVTESYSPEFRTPLPDEELLELVASGTGGVIDPDDEAVWGFDGEPAKTPKDTWWWWLCAAVVLLPFDIALRRLGA